MNNEKNIVLNLYCDEIKEYPLKISLTTTFEKWTYLGIYCTDLFRIVFKDLLNLRCLANA